jgi:hypothetical protein
MKRCPKCNRTFADDAQKFCTHDGGLLVSEVQPTVNFDPNATIITETLETDSPPTIPIRPSAQQDLNRTIASTMPPSPPPTTDFRHSETGPAVRPTSANLPPPVQPARQSIHASPPPAPSMPRAPQSPPAPPMPPRPAAAPPAPAMSGAPAPSAQPARKKSKLPWILGGLVVLGVLLSGVGAALYFVVLPRLFANANANTNTNTTENRNANTNTSANASASPVENNNALANQNESQHESANANSSPQPASEASHNVVPFAPPPNSVAFVNSKANLEGKLSEHYVDFSFYYPRSWKSDPKSGVAGASNFVKVERLLPPDYTQEQFAVAWYESGGTIETDRDKFPKLVETLNNSYKQFPEYRKVSEGDTKINSYDAHEFRFESVSRKTDKGDIKLWGRIVFLPPGVAGEKNGLILLMLATSLAPELSSVSDVGAKGEMPLILDSFRFGKTQ